VSDDGRDDHDDIDDDGFEWGPTDDQRSGNDDPWSGDDETHVADHDDAFDRTPSEVGTPSAAPATVGDDSDAPRRADAGVDADVAPWETGAGKGGFLRAVVESVGVIGVALVLALVFGIVGAVAMLFAGFEFPSTPVLVVSLVGTQSGFVVAVFAFLRWRGEPLSNVGLEVPDVKGIVLVVVGLVVTLATAIGVSIAVQFLDLQPAENATTAQASGDPTSLLLLIPVMLLVVGPAEELLFRGVIQRRLRERASAPVAIVLGGALFASVHFIALIGDLSAIATTIGILFFPSLVFGALYEYGKNVVVNALVHGLYNSVLLLIAYAALRFAPESAPAESGAAVVDALAVLL
jgi:membrane protease YdiL (CAAX protease family)